MGNTALTVNAPDLVGAIEGEMDRTWAEAHADDDYDRRQAEDDLLERHPLIAGMSGDALAAIVTLAEAGEEIGGEVAAAALIALERQLAAAV